jgi:hypothetical protein
MRRDPQREIATLRSLSIDRDRIDQIAIGSHQRASIRGL